MIIMIGTLENTISCEALHRELGFYDAFRHVCGKPHSRSI